MRWWSANGTTPASSVGVPSTSSGLRTAGGGIRALAVASIIESHEKFVKEVVKSIRLRDPQRRPVHDSSGWIHVDTDVWSIHDYTQTLQKKHLYISL